MRYHLFLFVLILFGCNPTIVYSQERNSSLVNKIICLDPGHGGTAETDNYRVGPSGEREEWINLRVSLILREMLQEKGAVVIMTRTGDENISLAERVKVAKENRADLFLSIHHNATADPAVNFPIVYFHGNASENRASVLLAQNITGALSDNMYDCPTPVSAVSDYTIFPEQGASVLRGTYGIPGVIAEASFFTNPDEERRLKKPEHNRREAISYVLALETFFEESASPILEKNSLVNIPPFRVFQEAERMNEEALLWYEDYLRGNEFMKGSSEKSLEQAYQFFTRSARSFPDSYVAGECHKYRSIILRKLGEPEEAIDAALRALEFYICADK